MRYIGAFEARNRPSELLALVERGEQIVIAKHRHPVAQLVAAENPRRAEVLKAIAAMKYFSAQHERSGGNSRMHRQGTVSLSVHFRRLGCLASGARRGDAHLR